VRNISPTALWQQGAVFIHGMIIAPQKQISILLLNYVALDLLANMWENNNMPKKSNKKKTPKDINKLATFIVEQTTKDKDDKTSPLDNTKKPHS
jgi:hypothetical protein